MLRISALKSDNGSASLAIFILNQWRQYPT